MSRPEQNPASFRFKRSRLSRNRTSGTFSQIAPSPARRAAGARFPRNAKVKARLGL